jgi:alpha-tubulin suppressor-like RCC1 family protein
MRAAILVLLSLLAAACGDTLVDHNADPNLLAGGTCGPALASCGGACVPEDASHCGASCAVCTDAGPDPNGTPACIGQACSWECKPGFLKVGGACERAVAVSAGFQHTCAVTTGGTLRCWGANEHGQLGDDTRTDSAVPVEVKLPGPATAVAAGYVHTCAVASGEVFCWGDNTTGDLGDGTTTLRAAPAKVAGLGGVTALAAGGGENAGAPGTYYGHSCAIASGGTIWCWGSNDSGQLGDGTTQPRLSPVKNADLRDPATALAIGDRHTCAIVAGAIWCWGANGSGQLGDGSTTSSPHPLQVLPSGAFIAAGAVHTCAVSGGALQCWGDNSSGQANFGVNTPGSFAKPNPVPLGPLVPAAAAGGGSHTCALGAGGEVVCFGANDRGQLGGPVSARGALAVTLPAARAITAGFAHSCALLSDGGVQCWGANDRGELGAPSGAGPAIATPTYVSGR